MPFRHTGDVGAGRDRVPLPHRQHERRGEAPHHRDGPLPLRLGRGSADLARRQAGGLRPRERQQEEGRLRHRRLDGGRRRQRAPAGVHERPGHESPLVARRDAARLQPRRREGRQAAASPGLGAPSPGRRGAGTHRPAQGGGRARLVARRDDNRVHEHDDGQGPGEEGREGGAREGRGARERRARDHAGRLSHERRGLPGSHPAPARMDDRGPRRRQPGHAAPDHDRRFRRGQPRLVARRQAPLLHVQPRARAVLRGAGHGRVLGGGGGRRGRESGRHRRVHRRLRALPRRPPHRLRRLAQRQAHALVRPARPLRRGRRRRAPEPHRGLRLRRGRRSHRGPARAPRRPAVASGLDEGRDPRQGFRAGAGQPAAGGSRVPQGRARHEGRRGGRGVHRHARRGAFRDGRLDTPLDRRRVRAGDGQRRAAAPDPVQRRAARRARPDSTRGPLVLELRRQEDPRARPEAARATRPARNIRSS